MQTNNTSEIKDGMNAKRTITLTEELICKLITLAEKWTNNDQFEESGTYEHLMHLSDSDMMTEGEDDGKAELAREILTEAGIPYTITKD